MEKQIVEAVNQALDRFASDSPSRGWSTLRGDICCRVIMQFIENSVGQTRRVAGPNAWVKGVPTEFDIIVTKPKATPYPFTAVYQPEDVLACIEVKEHGIYGGKEDLPGIIDRKKRQFTEVTDKWPRIRCGYLTLREVCKTAKKESINYLEETLKGLGHFPVFCLQDSRSQTIRVGEWGLFVQWLVNDIDNNQSKT